MVSLSFFKVSRYSHLVVSIYSFPPKFKLVFFYFWFSILIFFLMVYCLFNAWYFCLLICHVMTILLITMLSKLLTFIWFKFTYCLMFLSEKNSRILTYFQKNMHKFLLDSGKSKVLICKPENNIFFILL